MVTRPGSGTDGFPDAPGKETVLKLCVTCHGGGVITGKGLTRKGWGEIISNMVSKGAKGSDEEFATVLDYLATNLPPKTAAVDPRTAVSGNDKVAGRVKPKGGLGSGPDDAHIVDQAGAARGKQAYLADCASCHGPLARGTAKGSDLVRSLVVLHDRYGSQIGPFLSKGHPVTGGKQSTALAKATTDDITEFLHKNVTDTLRGSGGPYENVINVVTGDAKAGAAYFNGAGKCAGCHSPTGDLKGIANKYEPPALQQRFLFPQGISFGRGGVNRAKPVTVTVTPASGAAVTGVLDRIDDFDVSLRDSSGEYHSWKRVPGLKVEQHDPYAGHVALLDQYTDKNIHDIIAYLETLK